jgi:hypothetical protein
MVCRPWSVSGLPGAAWPTGGCGVRLVARVRAVVRLDSGPGRWCWRSAERGVAAGCRGDGLETLSVLRAPLGLLASLSAFEHPMLLLP